MRGIGIVVASAVAGVALVASSARAESVFEQLVRENGCAIPYPVESLHSRLAAFALPAPPARIDRNRIVLGTLIPDGRSLQAGFTDYERPRAILSLTRVDNLPGASGETSPRALDELTRRVFIGYTENAGELEVISWDNDLGRFSFQRVRNYRPGQRPVILGESYRASASAPTQREICLSCHQAEGPIFSRFPWRETNANRRESTVRDSAIGQRLLAAAHGRRDYHGFELSPEEPFRKLLVDKLDQNVRAANRLLQARTACATMCGNDVECRRRLLRTALERRLPSAFIEGGTLPQPIDNKSTFQAGGLPAGDVASIQPLLARSWPAGGFAHASSVLPDRDPLARDGAHSIFEIGPASSPTADDLGSNEPRTFNERHASSGLVALDERPVPADSDIGDPTTPRPLVSAIPVGDAGAFAVDVAFECLGFTAADTETLGHCSSEQITQLLETPIVRYALVGWTVNASDAPGAPASPTLRQLVLAQAQSSCGPATSTACLATGNSSALTLGAIAGENGSALSPGSAPTAATAACPGLMARDGQAPVGH